MNAESSQLLILLLLTSHVAAKGPCFLCTYFIKCHFIDHHSNFSPCYPNLSGNVRYRSEKHFVIWRVI